MSFRLAGYMKHRVTIFKPSDTKTGRFDDVSYEPLCTVWANVQPQRGKEYYDSQRLSNQLNVKIVIRYRDDIREGMQVSCKGHLYTIQSVVDPYLSGESLELYCIEKKRGR